MYISAGTIFAPQYVDKTAWVVWVKNGVALNSLDFDVVWPYSTGTVLTRANVGSSVYYQCFSLDTFPYNFYDIDGNL